MMERNQVAMSWWWDEDVTGGVVVMMGGEELDTKEVSKKRHIAPLQQHIFKLYLPCEDGTRRSWTRRRRRIQSHYGIASTFALPFSSYASASIYLLYIHLYHLAKLSFANLSYQSFFIQCDFKLER